MRQPLKIPRIIFTVRNAINFIVIHGRNTGAIQMRRGIVIKNKLRHLDLFSGIGGFSLGLEATGGFETVAFCEIENFPRQVLQKHWPHVKQYNDIKELTYDKLKEDGIGSIDIITGGYPCQPFSQAGRKKGEEDPRHLWPEYFRLIKECRPTWVIGENVSGHLKLGLDTVLKDLESEGYTLRTFSISAASIGANHKRERVWIVAYSERNRHQHTIQKSDGEEKEIPREHWKDNSTTRKSSGTNPIWETNNGDVENTRRSLRQGTFIREKNENEIEKENADLTQRPGEASQFDVANTKRVYVQGQHNGQGQRQPWGESWWTVEPDVGRVAHGIPDRVDRLKALGNSLVPHIPYCIALSILETLDA
jgi:DNA (cytosine-5)-methyltransferase 1